MIHKFVALINREQPAEMKHDTQVCKSIYRGQSAEYSVIHRFPAISTETNLLRPVYNQVYRGQSAEIKHNITVCNSIYRVRSAELKHDTQIAILPKESNMSR